MRGAYMIDVFAGLVFGYFWWIIAQNLSYYVDVNIFGMFF